MRGVAHAEFARAAEEFAAHPNSAEAINTMMELALEGADPTLRGWAAVWLKANCNIQIVHDTEQGQDDATTAKATGIL